ncbi:(2Fe-2S)-binding protein [Subtercola sp. Z020]|uniref:Rieske 2Fe-2S domain-containing protein n=1 Tax=Subtercola sp. Z020 TaxID=2080582 RepID=UPI000CE89EFC|nr:Rieske 2Fe-2S domain-containing protein [Subtercola sp. Z020]PPF87867.1 (2Fe-2S)-binding protein [Subtercola sp. Z020]
MRELSFVKIITRLENAEVLDSVVTRAQAVVKKVVQPQGLRDLLHGVPFGHPLHPVEVQVPIGAWLSAGILDALPMHGSGKAAQALIGVGVLSAAPAAVSGWTDWSELHEQQMRVGLVHAAGNAAAVLLYSASFVQRVRGRQASGKVLAYLGLAAVSGAGFLGGHLAYRQAAGANHAEDVPHVFPPGWQEVGDLDDLADGALERRIVAEQPLLFFRRGDEVNVLSDVCSHLSAPLHEGELDPGSPAPGSLGTGPLGEAPGSDPCVTCPWHGSVFSLTSGEVVHGPATSPQPRFETRVEHGRLSVLLPGAG